MTDRYEWPDDVMTTGAVMRSMETALAGPARGGHVYIERDKLREWLWCIIECGALLDPDNPPLTREQLAGLRRRRRPTEPTEGGSD